MKTIRDFDLKNKKVIIRVDFNVPINNDIIEDDTRIKAALETINYAIDNNARVVLLSHLGRVKKEEDKKSLKPVGVRLSELLGKPVKFVPFTKGQEVENAINNMENKDVILLENTRYEDLPNKDESKNNEQLGKYWASLGEIFINDAFGTIHRAHASNVGIATFLDSGIGFLVEKELKFLKKATDNPKRPFVVILGGSKISDKIGVIESLVKESDYILIGGGMAFTFLKAEGIEIGNSLLDVESLEFCKRILEENDDKIVLPIDVVTNTNRECFINEMNFEEQGLDIGYNTVKLFKQYLNASKTIIWNGPVGMFEKDEYSKGTIGICKILSETDALKIAGGGDTASAIKKFGYEEAFTHISTGGGATLEFLEGKKLPGIEILK